MQQYFPAASPQAINLLDRLLTFDPGRFMSKVGWGEERGARSGRVEALHWVAASQLRTASTTASTQRPSSRHTVVASLLVRTRRSPGHAADGGGSALWRPAVHWPPHSLGCPARVHSLPSVCLKKKIRSLPPTAKRLTVEQALAHPWLAALHDPSDEPSCPQVRFATGGLVGWGRFSGRQRRRVAACSCLGTDCVLHLCCCISAAAPLLLLLCW